MTIVTGISSQPKQQLSLQLSDGSLLSITMAYRPQQLGWFADFVWGGWTLNGLRLTAAPNLLRAYAEIIPFGLMLLTAGNVEPLNPTDFVNGTVTVYLLNAADVATVNASAYAGF